MFDFVQENRRPVQIVLALIIVPFALWGVDSYRKSGTASVVASVNGEKIGQQEFENALNQQQQRIREMAGAKFDPTFFDKPEIKHSVLDGLVTQHLMGIEARKAGLVLPDEKIAQIIYSISAFQKDGKLDRQLYESVLKKNGKTEAGFIAELRQSILAQELTEAYSQNGFATEVVTDNLIRLTEQQRIVSLATVDVDAFFKQVKVSESAVSDYYNLKSHEFQIPERANVEYVVLSADALLSQMKVTEEEVSAYYKEHLTDFGAKEKRQASEIFIYLGSKTNNAEKEAARGKAEQVLQLVKKTPAKFSELAKQYSQDPESAAKGGDIGLIERGMKLSSGQQNIVETLFSLKEGEVSDLIQTDAGYHIIKLVAIKGAKAQPLSEVKGGIEQRLKVQKANDKFAELAEEFNNKVYEQSDSLKPAAELAKTTVQRAGWLSKGQAPTGLLTEKALQAVFSEDALKNKRNTTAIEVGPNTLLAARVVEYKPTSAQPLSEVAAGIRKNLERQQATEMAAAEGQKLLEKLQRGEKSLVNWKTALSTTRNQRAGIDPALQQAVFRAGTDKLPAYVGVNGPNGFLLARIDAVKDPVSIDEAKRRGYAQQLRQITGEELLMSYMADAKKRADITMKDFSAETK